MEEAKRKVKPVYYYVYGGQEHVEYRSCNPSLDYEYLRTSLPFEDISLRRKTYNEPISHIFVYIASWTLKLCNLLT